MDLGLLSREQPLQLNDDRVLDGAVVNVNLEQGDAPPAQQPLYREHRHVVRAHALLAAVVQPPASCRLTND